MTYTELIELIDNGMNMSFQRWGDGEFIAMAAVHERVKWQHNTDKHLYYRDMGQELIAALMTYKPEDVNYIHALQPKAIADFPNWVAKYYTPFIPEPHTNSDILHNASIDGELHLFVNALKGRHIILVGPERLKPLKRVFGFDHVIIPDLNCWRTNKETMRQITDRIKPDSVVLYSASMMSNALIDRLWSKYKSSITQIDCGSVWEPYIGNANRRYHIELLKNKPKLI